MFTLPNSGIKLMPMPQRPDLNNVVQGQSQRDCPAMNCDNDSAN
jgi:hypothetical protein